MGHGAVCVIMQPAWAARSSGHGAGSGYGSGCGYGAGSGMG